MCTGYSLGFWFFFRVLPLKRTAEEKAQAEHAAAISNFKSMLQDKGDITSSSRWSKVGACQPCLVCMNEFLISLKIQVIKRMHASVFLGKTTVAVLNLWSLPNPHTLADLSPILSFFSTLSWYKWFYSKNLLSKC